MNIKRLYAYILAIVPAFVVLSTSVSAVSASVNYNDLIDDGVFDNYNTMSSSQIDNFLNSFSSSCISSNNGFRAPDPTGYNSTAKFTYGSNVTAGKVIYDAAHAYEINPEVLLATLQKEQSLVTGTSGCSTLRYVGALGYGCPDGGTTHNYSGINLYTLNGKTVTSVSGTCVDSSSYVGFSRQIINAAWLLKFDRMRSEGRVTWYINKTNWNNSDDLEFTYSGYMTQGTWQRQESLPATYYDGYATIDSSSIHMNTGATAALYDYTPHKSGNSNFVTIFTSWFGSTSYPQPVGAGLDRQSSTGRVFFVQDNSDGSITRYYIPSFSIMQNYGFDKYPTVSVDDATISSMTDGGTLTNLIRSSGGNIYLVNHSKKYYIPSTSICTAWGLDCMNSTVAHTLNSVFESSYLATGGNLATLMHYGNVYYELANGTREPFANFTTMQASGFSAAHALPADATNATQPLGPLILTTAGVIRFSPNPTIYYFDGSNYYTVGSMAAYDAWGLSNQMHISAPLSSFNSSATPTVAASLGLWGVDGSGNKYVIDSGKKYRLTTTQQDYWPKASYETAPTSLFDILTSASLSTFVRSGVNLYSLSTPGTKNYIPTINDYEYLGGNSTNTVYLSPILTTPIPNGSLALADGHLLRVDGGSTIYIVNNGTLLRIPDMDTYNAYNFTSGISKYSSADLAGGYPVSGTLGSIKGADGSVYYPYSDRLLQLTPSMATSYGANTSTFPVAHGETLVTAKPILMTEFLRNSTDGKIYYGSGGALHYVSSGTSLRRYGGDRIPITSVDTTIINTFSLGAPI